MRVHDVLQRDSAAGLRIAAAAADWLSSVFNKKAAETNEYKNVVIYVSFSGVVVNYKLPRLFFTGVIGDIQHLQV